MPLPPALLAAIQAKAQGGQAGPPVAPTGPDAGLPSGLMPNKPGTKKKKKKPAKKLTAAEKKAAIERRMSKSGNGSSKPNPFAGK